MAVANHEASKLVFLGLSGMFDVNAPKTSSGWLGWLPYSGVWAQAVQSVSITSRNSAENLLAVGYKGHAGYSRRFGGVDVNIDAVLTDNVLVSGALGYELADFDNKLPGTLVLYTTNRAVGRVATVSGLYVNSINFSFNQNANSTTAWTFVGDSVVWSGYDVSAQGIQGYETNHCVNPLTWDEVHILDGGNNVLLTGVQSVTFSASFNRQDIFQIGQFEPYDRSVTYPYAVSVSINTLANDVNLTNWWDKFVPSYDPSSNCASGILVGVRLGSNTEHDGTGANGDKFILYASGLRPTQGTLNTAVGSNSTVTLNFEGTDLFF